MRITVKPYTDSSFRRTAEIEIEGSDAFSIFLESALPLSPADDFWAAFLIPIGMSLGSDIYIDGKVSNSFLEASDAIQKEYLKGHKSMREIKVVSSHVFTNFQETKSPQKSTATFFSGGLDSTYTAMNLGSGISLISVHGFDIPWKNSSHWTLSLAGIESFAALQEMKVISLRTNLRDFSDQYLDWARDYHGAALSGVALALGEKFDQIYIPATYTNEKFEFGSFPSLEASFSTDYVKLRQHGVVSRIEKASFVGKYELAKKVRVCWQNREGQINCGVCQKCVRTRFEFQGVRAAHAPENLGKQVKISEIFSLRLSKNDFEFFLQDLRWMRQNQVERSLLTYPALKFARFHYIIRKVLKSFLRFASKAR